MRQTRPKSRTAYLVALSIALASIAVVCTAEGQPPLGGTPQPTTPTASAAGATASPTRTPTPTPTPEPAIWSAPRLDVEPGALIADYGPREGWDGGRPGAARGALVALHPETAEELPGYRPIDVGQAPHLVPSPDGRLAALTRHQTQDSGATIEIVDFAKWTVEPAFDEAHRYGWGISWSPDAATLYAVRYFSWPTPHAEIHAFDLATRKSHLIAAVDYDYAGAVMVSPDGSSLYALAHRAKQCCGIDVIGDPFIAVVDVATGETEEIPLPDLRTGQRMEFRAGQDTEMSVSRRPAVAMAPDGSRLFIAHAEEDLVTVVDLDTRTVVQTIRPEPARSALSRLGSWLLDRFASRAEAKGGASFAKQIAVSPDGRTLYVTGTADEICDDMAYFACVVGAPIGLQVIDASTLELVAKFEDIGQMKLTPDGRWLVGSGWAYDYRDESSDWAKEIPYGLTIIDTEALEVVGRAELAVYHQVTLSPDSRFAYAISNGPGHRESMTNGGRCTEACYHLSVFALPSGSLLAQRDLLGYIQLRSPLGR